MDTSISVETYDDKIINFFTVHWGSPNNDGSMDSENDILKMMLSQIHKRLESEDIKISNIKHISFEPENYEKGDLCKL